jgi:hypothetical protein
MLRIKYSVISAATGGVILLGSLVACGVGYSTAMKSGAQYEAQIAATHGKVAQLDEKLRLEIAAATGLDMLTAKEVRRAVVLATRRPGPEGEKIIMRELHVDLEEPADYSPTVSRAVMVALRRHSAMSLRLRNLEKAQSREYSSKLESSGWEGTWLRAAGYPKNSP